MPFLDPSRYPRRIDLELPDQIFERLHELARRSDRSLAELAQELIDRALAES